MQAARSALPRGSQPQAPAGNPELVQNSTFFPPFLDLELTWSMHAGCPQNAWLAEREATMAAAKAVADDRRPFEEGIKRTYFHVKPLDASQLANWVRGMHSTARGGLLQPCGFGAAGFEPACTAFPPKAKARLSQCSVHACSAATWTAPFAAALCCTGALWRHA